MEFPGYWGVWGSEEFCKNHGYAVGFATKVEGKQGGGDDTAMNGLKLQCSDGDFLNSEYFQKWGSWDNAWNSCPSGFTGANVRIEGKQGVIYTLFTWGTYLNIQFPAL